MCSLLLTMYYTEYMKTSWWTSTVAWLVSPAGQLPEEAMLGRKG